MAPVGGAAVRRPEAVQERVSVFEAGRATVGAQLVILVLFKRPRHAWAA